MVFRFFEAMFGTPDNQVKLSQKTKQSCAWANCWALKLPESEYCGPHLKEAMRGHVGAPPKTKTSTKKAKPSSVKKKPKESSTSSILSSLSLSSSSSSSSSSPTPAPKSSEPPKQPEPFRTGVANFKEPTSPKPAAAAAEAKPQVESRVSKPVPKVTAVPNSQGSNAEKEAAARKWVLAVLAEEGKMDLQGLLKSGVRLCKLWNALNPSAASVLFSVDNRSFVHKDNISNYLAACRSMGFKKSDCFSPDDLYEDKDMPAVVHNLLVLEAHMRASGYKGPRID